MAHQQPDLSALDQAFPGLLAKFPVVRDRNYYRPPNRPAKKGPRQQQQQQQGLLQLPAGGGSDGGVLPGSFWDAVSATLKGAVGPDWEPQVRLAMLQLYHQHVVNLNLEEIEDMAKALTAIEQQQQQPQPAK